jgi:hypothetical protein
LCHGTRLATTKDEVMRKPGRAQNVIAGRINGIRVIIKDIPIN